MMKRSTQSLPGNLRTDIDRVRALIELASTKSSDDAAEAIELLTQALHEANRHVEHVSRDKGRWKELRIRILLARGMRFESIEATAKAFADANEAQAQLQDEIPRELHQQVQMLYGRRLMFHGHLDEALQVFKDLWEITDFDGDPSVAGMVAGNLATVIFHLKHFEESIPWFERSAEYFLVAGQPAKRAQSIRGIGMAYSKLGRYTDALRQYEQATEILQDITAPPVRELISVLESIGVDHLNLADRTGKQTHYKTALANFEMCSALAEQHGLTTARIVAMRNLGLVYAETPFKGHNLRKAHELLAGGLCLAQANGIRLLEGELQRELSNVLEASGRAAEALSALREWFRIEREIMNAKADERVRSLERQLATARADAERQAAIERADMLSLEVDRQRRQVTAVTMGISQKNTALHDTRQRLRILADATSDAGTAAQLRMLSRALDREETTDTYWEGLEEQLALIHSSALNELSRRHPTLTPTERRVCALIRHGLSTKDIARLLGTEARSIEKYRQRIRKKLNLSASDNLSTYLSSL